jgi:hypothetical protein
MSANAWPELPYAEWRETRDTLHMWTQIVGKIRLALTPLVNHWWNVPLYVSARGLTTSTILMGARWLEIEFDFIEHVVRFRVNTGDERLMRLEPRSVADFYRETLSVLRELDIDAKIWSMPVEVSNPIAFELDEQHHSYDREAVEKFWQILALTTSIFTDFRAEFIGKCSPIHLFWGSLDLAVTRFSGRAVPPRPEVDAMTNEAYSHEVISTGWWPGDERLTESSFYAYAYPEPPGYPRAMIKPSEAYYHDELKGFYLPYDVVRKSPDPTETLLAFCRSTYATAADLAEWDRESLERRS